MKLNKDELENLKYVINEILNPVFEGNKEEIKTILCENEDFRKRVEDKVSKILKDRV